VRPQLLVSDEKSPTPRVVRGGDRRSWGILVRRQLGREGDVLHWNSRSSYKGAGGYEGAKPPCQCRAPSGAHIKTLGRRPDLMGGAQLGHPSVVIAGESLRAREASPARHQCSFVAGPMTTATKRRVWTRNTAPARQPQHQGARS
jgi:hypothetical protein